MQQKLKKILHNKYPALYGGRTNLDQLPIKCAVSCDDGWFQLIDVLSKLIVAHYPDATAILIKEKYGTLRFHLAHYPNDNYLFGLINMAESISEIVCEKCGHNGDMYYHNWVKVRCEKHKVHNEYKKEVIDLNGLPFDINDIGSMRSEMIVILLRQINMHEKYNQMPPVNFTKFEVISDKLSIKYAGGNRNTAGMVDLLIKYANTVDPETGAITVIDI